MGKTKITGAALSALIESRQRGTTIKELAAWFHVTHTTVIRLLRKHGVERPEVESFDVAEAVRLYEAGTTLTDLALRFDRDTATIKKWLRRRGVTIRKTWSRRTGPVIELPHNDVIDAYLSGTPVSELADQYGVRPATIYRVVKGRARPPGPVPVKTEREKLSRRLQRTYGLTVEQYDQMLEQQGGVCGICGVPPNHIRNHGKALLCVDHQHTTQRVRGLLCHTCNVGLGLFADTSEWLRRAAEYVHVDP